ncbi:MAG: ATP-binding cassette domain-containing protein, partial [Opitutae bacterium]|nr:ATP-binding cassette domain-containing protein [Opitutae bacterium]
MIQVEHLVKKFGLRTAVDDVSFEVGKGTVLGVLGPNGAGKTTTIRMIAG